ncbi:MAG: hypothetical protein ABEN55_07665, partial [Bradymonadaceae bacterium]
VIADWQGNHGRADHLFAEALSSAESFDDTFTRAEILYRQGVAYRRRGDVDKASLAIEDALETLSRGYRPDLWIEALSQMALCKSHLGDESGANRYASDALMFATEFGNRVLLERVRLGRAELRLGSTGRPDQIVETMEESIEKIREAGTIVPELLEMIFRYGVTVEQVAPGRPTPLVDEARERAEAIGAGALTASE